MRFYFVYLLLYSLINSSFLFLLFRGDLLWILIILLWRLVGVKFGLVSRISLWKSFWEVVKFEVVVKVVVVGISNWSFILIFFILSIVDWGMRLGFWFKL